MKTLITLIVLINQSFKHQFVYTLVFICSVLKPNIAVAFKLFCDDLTSQNFKLVLVLFCLIKAFGVQMPK